MITWQPIPGFPGYLASADGIVKTPKGRLSKANVGSHGYWMINMKDGSGKWGAHLLHAIIASAFHGARPAGLVCCHNDGNPLNPAADNLRWDTQKNNIADQKKHGTFKWHGEKKLPDSDILTINARLLAGESSKVIAAEFDVSRSTVCAIALGINWGSLTGIAREMRGANRERARGHKIKSVLKNEDVLDIVKRIDAGEQLKALAMEFGVRPQTVSCIHRGLSWAWLTGRLQNGIASATLQGSSNPSV